MVASIDLFYIFLLWLTTFVIGLISWPITALFCQKFTDNGYSIAKLLGAVVIAYLVFLLVTIHVLSLSAYTIFLIASLWATVNAIIQLKTKAIGNLRKKWKRLLGTELAIIALTFFIVYLRAHSPQITGIERFMDFGVLQMLFNASTLPIYDFWFAGEYFNYYYFGHFLGYILLQLSRVPIVPGFFLLIAWIFALMGINVYRIAHELSLSIINNRRAALLAGIISFCCVMLIGTLYTDKWLFEFIKGYFRGTEIPNYYFAEPTRIIPGTILEMPIYGVLVADIHAHMWGLLMGILVLAGIFALNNPDEDPIPKSRLCLLSFLLGISYMTNAWDVVTLGCLIVSFVLMYGWKQPKLKLLATLLFLIVFSHIIALPWSYYNRPPVTGVGFVETPSPFLPWFSYWGLSFIFLVMYLIHIGYQYVTTKNESGLLTKHRIPLIITLNIIFFLHLIEIFYVNDALSGEHLRANTVFKIGNQLWLWSGVLLGPIIIWLYQSYRKPITKTVFCLTTVLLFIGPISYPFIAIKQGASISESIKRFDAGINWWQERYPDDYAAYAFLEKIKNKSPKEQKIQYIIEAPGNAFTDQSRFSVFLGWPTVIGWVNHELTWRNNWPEISKRIEDVKQLYTDNNLEKTRQILKKYNVQYIVVGPNEQKKYGKELNLDKLKSIGKVVFIKGDVRIFKIKDVATNSPKK